jgi:hypothetical protein
MTNGPQLRLLDEEEQALLNESMSDMDKAPNLDAPDGDEVERTTNT